MKEEEKLKKKEDIDAGHWQENRDKRGKEDKHNKSQASPLSKGVWNHQQTREHISNHKSFSNCNVFTITRANILIGLPRFHLYGNMKSNHN